MSVRKKYRYIEITGWGSKFYTEVGSFSMEPGVGYPLGSLSTTPEVGGDKGWAGSEGPSEGDLVNDGCALVLICSEGLELDVGADQE